MERDEETGLSYHNARYYIPWLCRWMNPDPIGIGDGVNVYAYCKNDPVGNSDPDGTQTKEEIKPTKEVQDIIDKYNRDHTTWEAVFDPKTGGWIEQKKSIKTENENKEAEKEKSTDKTINQVDLQKENVVNKENSTNASADCKIDCGGYTTEQLLNKAKGLAIKAKDIADPKIDLPLGAAEYKLGTILSRNKPWQSTKAPWELPQIKSTTTVIRTPAGNIHAPTNALSKLGTALKWTGRAVGALGLLGTYIDYKQKKIGTGEALTDAIFGVIGFIPPVGWAISAAYFLIAKPLLKPDPNHIDMAKPIRGPIQDKVYVAPKFIFNPNLR